MEFIVKIKRIFIQLIKSILFMNGTFNYFFSIEKPLHTGPDEVNKSGVFRSPLWLVSKFSKEKIKQIRMRIVCIRGDDP